MHVEIAPVPADQEPDGERHDDQTDRCFGTALDRPRQVTAEEHDGKSERKERGRVTQPPSQTERRGSARPVSRVPQEEGRDGGEMIRIGGVPQPQQKRDHEGHDSAVAQSGNELIWSKHA